MKKLSIAIASLFTVAAPLTHAAYDRYGNYYEPRTAYEAPRSAPDTARVIESKPVYEAAGSREECWNPRAGHFEERRSGQRDSLANGTAIGAIAGGVLGHQFDSGAGTIAGALLGGLAGRQIDKQHNSGGQDDLDLSRCRVVGGGTGGLAGYDVRYSYNGQEYVTRMSSDPGRRLRVGQDIREDGTPLESSAPSYSYSQPYWR